MTRKTVTKRKALKGGWGGKTKTVRIIQTGVKNVTGQKTRIDDQVLKRVPAEQFCRQFRIQTSFSPSLSTRAQFIGGKRGREP